VRDLLTLNQKRVVAIVDNDKNLPSPFNDVSIFYGEHGFRQFLESRNRNLGPNSSLGGVVAIGGAKGKERVDIYNFLMNEGLEVEALVHKSAIVTNSATIGQGSQILANVFIGSEAVVGEFCIVNSSSSIDHECSLGVGVHVAPGAVLAGDVTVEDHAFIGANSTILPGVRIGFGAIIGAGAVVTRDVTAGLCVVGNPAVPLKKQLKNPLSEGN
jgi:sugar O-acyltransferase (sialic acid O-acetyltransferase NeuD family)